MWFNGAEFTNPPGGQVLVQTGALTSNEHDVVLAVQASVQALGLLEHRNATDTVTLKEYKLRLATGEYVRTFTGINTQSGERLRVSLVSGLTGVIEADLFVVVRPTVPQLSAP